jgi:hypothetical protein
VGFTGRIVAPPGGAGLVPGGGRVGALRSPARGRGRVAQTGSGREEGSGRGGGGAGRIAGTAGFTTRQRVTNGESWRSRWVIEAGRSRRPGRDHRPARRRDRAGARASVKTISVGFWRPLNPVVEGETRPRPRKSASGGVVRRDRGTPRLSWPSTEGSRRRSRPLLQLKRLRKSKSGGDSLGALQPEHLWCKVPGTPTRGANRCGPCRSSPGCNETCSELRARPHGGALKEFVVARAPPGEAKRSRARASCACARPPGAPGRRPAPRDEVHRALSGGRLLPAPRADARSHLAAPGPALPAAR